MERLVNIIYKKFKRILSNLEYDYGWLRVINSPFVKLKWEFKWYKKPTLGTPFFLPGKWIKFDKKHAIEWAKERVGEQTPKFKNYLFEDIVNYAMQHMSRPVSIKYFGINCWSLGYKSKWLDTDIRFEWGPGLSLILFGTQLVIYPTPNCDFYSISDYWEAWIIYNKHTDKTKSIKERLRESMELYPAKWIRYKEGKQISVNYWNYILKDKYKCLIDSETRQSTWNKDYLI